MERVKSILQRRLEVVKKRKELLVLEEARLVRMAKQKKNVAVKLAKVKSEKLAIMEEEARLLRALKQSAPY
ncbi:MULTISPECIES: hypothetical protein [Thermococcus]|uniref:Uncharacterized protein n=1 Tax=Thermococcus nautili TaxID=195522 RepID=W8PIZ2_9EURY|nr:MULTISPECIES: hypothetical protein [Thermococcus]AHL22079.1 hypothetical protein BD01_0454 [Thermococcus nautili]NJE48683.1 hypothetical protein [Thermococcus sp. 9N3]CAI1493871.1 conserved protein of unknown function [Thermococcus nautili]